MLGFAFTPIKCQKSQKISLLEGASPAPRIKVTSVFEAAVPSSARLRRYRIEASRHAITLRPRLSLGKRLLLHRLGQQRPRRSPTSTSSRPPGQANGGEPTDDDRRPRCGENSSSEGCAAHEPEPTDAIVELESNTDAGRITVAASEAFQNSSRQLDLDDVVLSFSPDLFMGVGIAPGGPHTRCGAALLPRPASLGALEANLSNGTRGRCLLLSRLFLFEENRTNRSGAWYYRFVTMEPQC